MCGIAGLLAKTEAERDRLGADLAAMIERLAARGPDSAGLAIYADREAGAPTRASLLDPLGGDVDWAALCASIDSDLGRAEVLAARGDQADLGVECEPELLLAWLDERRPDLVPMSVGATVTTAKRAGHPSRLIAELNLAEQAGTHAIAHTRMATESRVGTDLCHPFCGGPDLALVHNGSLSNHNELRRRLARRGVAVRTDNDSEVAAAYLGDRIGAGDSTEEALGGCLVDLDGFYTFAVADATGLAVLRDPIGCKPAILAETEDWIAVASEPGAIAVLPGAAAAEISEPEPGRVYSWTLAGVPA
jgi:glutamate synthase domain-containing protein 1